MKSAVMALFAGAALALAPAAADAPPPDGLAQASADSAYDQALPVEQTDRDKFRAGLETALASPARSLEHRLRDDRREVRAIIAATRIHEGQRALDVGAGGGYLAAILAQLAGPSGHTDIHNTPGWIAQFPSMDPEVQANQFSGENIGFITTPWDRIDAPVESYDVVVMGQVYHDALLEGADIDAMNRSLFSLLKPGGRLVIEDHAADPAMPIGQQVGLHRIAADVVSNQIQSAGFQRIDLIAIPSQHDNKRFNVFRPGLRGRTERFILIFGKPAD